MTSEESGGEAMHQPCTGFGLPSFHEEMMITIGTPIGKYGKTHRKMEVYPLVNTLTKNELERSTIFNGKINYFDWAIFNIDMLVYQRVLVT